MNFCLNMALIETSFEALGKIGKIKKQDLI